MTEDDVRDPPPRDAPDDDRPSTERWNPESPFCTDERGSFFAHGHRVSVGRIYRDTADGSFRAVHSVDEEARDAVLCAVERDDADDEEFTPVDDDVPLAVSWCDDGGRFVPV
jgi:hypothetical protein